VNVLSPDLRQDDKPRLDKAMEIPAGALVYKVAMTASNVEATAQSNTLTTNAIGGITATSSATADLAFPEFVEAGNLDLSATAPTSPTAVQVTASDAVKAADPSDQAAIIVEVCYAVIGGAPVLDDVNLPFKVEAGQGT
jgi:hypothetical protein